MIVKWIALKSSLRTCIATRGCNGFQFCVERHGLASRDHQNGGTTHASFQESAPADLTFLTYLARGVVLFVPRLHVRVCGPGVEHRLRRKRSRVRILAVAFPIGWPFRQDACQGLEHTHLVLIVSPCCWVDLLIPVFARWNSFVSRCWMNFLPANPSLHPHASSILNALSCPSYAGSSSRWFESDQVRPARPGRDSAAVRSAH
ncbi:hypothetical protein EGW08_019014 [Elysia chlorotica]|uniref:Uncharacterized protein n=1 Tax=Elysia chlorotica TaxID=188477 RepID=A0A433SVF8_ELYCH|nr:hypothetical protein EGW08_019014 [Elysia chlorotica]